jgi:hypothetical protein
MLFLVRVLFACDLISYPSLNQTLKEAKLCAIFEFVDVENLNSSKKFPTIYQDSKHIANLSSYVSLID